jgi:hypothetical protein
MGAYRFSPVFLVAVAVLSTACSEQQRETVTGPEFKTTPPPGACDFGALPGLVRNYFPGSRQNYIVGLAGSMATAGQFTSGARNAGFQIMDSVGFLSRDASVTSNAGAGANLTVGLINCMFENASTFTYPTGAVADLTKALTKASGGAYYVRGGSRDGLGVAGADYNTIPGESTVLSGVAPFSGETWTSILGGTANSGSEGRALIYGYLVTATPLVYEWATVPSGVEFNPGALVSVCNNDTDSTAMIHESNIGVLAYSNSTICGQAQATAMVGGWGARELATRLTRAIADAIRPAPLQATMLLKTGSTGTASTFKSRFSGQHVETVAFGFTQAPKTIFFKEQPDTVIVRATTTVDGVTTGVNGVCVYLTGTNNNGQNTALVGGSNECDRPTNGISAKTKSITTANGLAAGYATFSVTVTKTGGLVFIASATDAANTTGVLGRSGQTFVSATFKTNVKP